jgi:hypothetical protein
MSIEILTVSVTYMSHLGMHDRLPAGPDAEHEALPGAPGHSWGTQKFGNNARG